MYCTVRTVYGTYLIWYLRQDSTYYIGLRIEKVALVLGTTYCTLKEKAIYFIISKH